MFAEPDPDPANPGGWHMVVAIADVAHYVRPGDALDQEARRRANSVYFPDRVLPMLPEALSNGLCSLRPDEDRACLAVHLWYDRRGRKLRHRFVRALMRSRARLTYEQVQAAVDGAAGPGQRSRRPCSSRRSGRSTAPMRPWPRRGAGAARWTSICPRPRSGSARTGARRRS